MTRWDDDEWDDDDDYADDAWSQAEQAVEPCPYCGEDVWEEAQRCPHCGNYLSAEEARRPMQPLWVVVTAVALLATMLWLMF
jgi:predicted nucleic acid-binding Zn ribbon protein